MTLETIISKVSHVNTLSDCINSSFAAFADRPALDIDDSIYSYGDVASKTNAIAHSLMDSDSCGGFVGIFATRSVIAYAGIYATLLTGKGYLPLNPRFPPQRLDSMVRRADCDTIILSSEALASFRAAAGALPPLTVICAEPECDLSKDFPQHSFHLVDWSHRASIDFKPVMPDSPAYLLFTSGSTGVPKGVVVSHSNVCSYIGHTTHRYSITPSDRLSQMFDLTFDLSVHDIFVAMVGGAVLCVVPERQVMAPFKFIREKELTVWFSVPSVAMFMSRMGALTPGAFPTLRCSLFCGEALPAKSAEQWQAAAPNSTVENLYGPTETTIAITSYCWDGERSPNECVNGVVPIGTVYPGHGIRIVDGGLQETATGEAGELCLSGPQVTGGYLNNTEETAKRFVRLDGSPDIWYRTGDLVRNAQAGLAYLGRIDEQIQIRGYRAELQEIDKVLRDAVGHEMAVAVPVYAGDGVTIATIRGYVESSDSRLVPVEAVLRHCREKLPEYMTPSKIVVVEKLPRNANGKIDRKGLSQWK